jgi:hypothetical protein
VDTIVLVRKESTMPRTHPPCLPEHQQQIIEPVRGEGGAE